RKACEGSCALETAQRINAEVSLSGSVRKPGRIHRAFVRCYRARDGSIVGQAVVEGSNVDALLADLKKQGDQLFRALEQRPAAGGAPSPPPAEAQPGFLTVLSQPRAQVSIDGESAGRTPLRRRKLDAGAHLVVLSAEGFQAVSRTVEVHPGAEARLSESLLEQA